MFPTLLQFQIHPWAGSLSVVSMAVAVLGAAAALAAWKRHSRHLALGSVALIASGVGTWTIAGKSELVYQTVTISSFGALTILAIALLAYAVPRLTRADGLDESRAERSLVIGCGCGLAAGHACAVFGPPQAPLLGHSLVVLLPWAAVGGLAGGSAWALRERLPLRRLLDSVAPLLALLWAIMSIAAYFEGSNYGPTMPSWFPSGVTHFGSYPRWPGRWPLGALAWVQQAERGWVGSTSEASLPVHPIALYQAGVGAVVFVVVTFWGRGRTSAFDLVAWFWILSTYVTEIFRADVLSLPSAISEWALSAGPALLGIGFVASLWNRPWNHRGWILLPGFLGALAISQLHWLRSTPTIPTWPQAAAAVAALLIALVPSRSETPFEQRA